MRIMVERAGPAANLRLEAFACPTPDAGEVLIEVEAGGVAFADVMLRLGVYPGFRPPVTPGYDAVGHIVAIGADVTDFAVGQRVAAMLIVGGYASHVVAKPAWIVPAPEKVAAESVAAAILNYVTAYQMLTRSAQIERGDSIVVHGAAGGVGTALLDLARDRGVHAFGTASRGKHAVVAGFGATPIDYKTDDFVAIALGKGGVQAVFDHVGGDHLLRSLRAIRPSGVVVSYGAYGIFKDGRISPLGAAKAFLARLSLDPMRLLGRSDTLVGYGVGVLRDQRNRAFREDFTSVMALLQAGRITPVVDCVLPLAKAAEAHKRLQSSSASGKIVLSMSGVVQGE
jgi:NADPH:quinone reductase-like Zn-dependent oxidoreductase